MMKFDSKDKYSAQYIHHRLWELYNKDDSQSTDVAWKVDEHQDFYHKLADALNENNYKLYLKIGYEENPYITGSLHADDERLIIDTFLKEHIDSTFNDKIKGYLE